MVKDADELRANPGGMASSNGANTGAAKRGSVGFIGLGRMGTAMAANLAGAGYRVIADVRRAERFAEAKSLGLEPTAEITDLSGCEFIISMLPDDNAARAVVLGGLAAALKPGAIHISMSTISTMASAQLAAEHARCEQGYVAAPVFGNPDAAKARQLFIVAAGAATDVQRCQPLFDNLGQKTFVISTNPEHANLVKLLGNMMTATTLEMLGEVIAVALKRGLDPRSFIDIMTSTMFGGRAHKIYGEKIIRESYTAGFVIPLVLKDVRLALAEAEKAGAPMPSVNVVRDRLITGIARGYADLDWTVLGLIAAEEAGLEANLPRSVN
jgi:3-hydroxyisobutyrate dehydrogenase-like beta-hydroxyacid dehydrogenase